MTMDDINSVELVFGHDQDFVVMPDSIRAKSDIPTTRQRAVYIGRHGSAAYLNLPDLPPAPQKRDDGLILARADLRTALDKAHYIGTHGAEMYLELPPERPTPE